METSRNFSFPVEGTNHVSWTLHDRGRWQTDGDILTIADGWASLDGFSMENVSLEFDARCPESEAQVQIWAGLRHYSQDYRYVMALRGGNNNHAYLARMGAEGYDKMLNLRPLEWAPMPGVWYHVRMVCAGKNLALYFNHETTPILMAADEAPFTEGSISLGGSYVPTQYRNVHVKAVEADCLDAVTAAEDYITSVTLTPQEKEKKRRRDRATYRPYCVPRLPKERAELSLDGNWLFIPGYELEAAAGAEVSAGAAEDLAAASAADAPAQPHFDDSRAHIMQVPASWVPLRAWLEGESMGELSKGMNDTYLVEERIRCQNQTFEYEKARYAWYRHYLDLPAGICEKRVVLDFEGIALISAVYINGKKIHENIGMFTPQQIDISGYVKPGRNVIAVEVHRMLSGESEHAFKASDVDSKYATAWDILEDEKVETSQWEHREFCTDDIPHGFYSDYPGGIWRSAKLIISNKTHVDECYFVPTLEDAEIEVQYSNAAETECKAALSYSLTHKTTGEFLCGGPVEEYLLAAGESRCIRFSTPKVNPRLWGPKTPNLYELKFTLEAGGEVIDVFKEQVGFRTVSFDGATLLYNGKPLWVRGGNHMPAHVNPNNKELARKFMSLALEHNCIATRTHVAPWGSAWLDAADEAGLMVSMEGTWTWLMLEHIPSERSIRIWKEELELLLRRHRNRPSLFLMTMNNEMKFYLHEAPDEVVIEKGHLLEGGIRMVRKTVPHLSLVCDSAYYRKHVIRSGRYERIIQKFGYDDGDMDDPHGYFGWYNPCFFHFMNGEFGEEYALPGRPCMSQECATGYPRAEDGLPTRAYLYMHQTPQTTVGKKAYEYNDPATFLSRHAMLTKELVEMFRRVEHDRTCGVLLFAFETWFYNQSDYRRIQPMESAKKLRLAYQPVLASAELFGRHFYLGETLQTSVTLVNDAMDYRTLKAPEAVVTLVADVPGKAQSTVLAQTTLRFESLPYFETKTLPVSLEIPASVGAERMNARLVLKVLEEGAVISENEYDVLLASKSWAQPKKDGITCFCLEEDEVSKKLLSYYQYKAKTCGGIDELAELPQPLRLIISRPVTQKEGAALAALAEKGADVILLGQKEIPETLLGGQISFTEHRQEIVTMNMPENSVFDGMEYLDLSWFTDGRQVPYAAYGRYSVDRFVKDITVLLETLEWHGYISKPTDYKAFGGTPLFSKKAGKGNILVSAVRTDAVQLDPVADRLNGNVIGWDFEA